MGAIEFIANNLNIINKKFVRNMMPKEWKWCKFIYLYRADFSLVNNEIYVYTRDYSDEPDDYYLNKEEAKTFLHIPRFLFRKILLSIIMSEFGKESI